jgi:hypothetical protein
VDIAEYAVGAVLVLILLALGGLYGWGQLWLLRRLRHQSEGSALEQSYLRSRAVRRLICSLLILLLAGLLVGSYFIERGLPPQDNKAEGKGADEAAGPDQEQRDFIRLFTGYWIGIFVLFLVILTLAAVDVLATRRFALRQLNQIDESQRVLLEQQAARLRGRRNGHQ